MGELRAELRRAPTIWLPDYRFAMARAAQRDLRSERNAPRAHGVGRSVFLDSLITASSQRRLVGILQLLVCGALRRLQFQCIGLFMTRQWGMGLTKPQTELGGGPRTAGEMN
ncbi:MAG: hypothetical protein ACC646_02340 [Paracoccaceae bacterium]